MPRLRALLIKDYKALRRAAFGFTGSRIVDLSPLTALIGPNGVGKSTTLDTLSFLADLLSGGVEIACDEGGRGGFTRVVRQGQSNVSITFTFEVSTSDSLVYSCELHEMNGRPTIQFETLFMGDTQARFVMHRAGSRVSLQSSPARKTQAPSAAGMRVEQLPPKDEEILTDPSRLAIATLGQLAGHPHITALRDYLSRWYLCYFQPEAARGIPAAGPQRRLNRTGSNLGNYIQYLDRNHPAELKGALASATRKIPGLQRIEHKRTEDGRLLLSFNERGYRDPFYQMSMSDGTLKLLAYLLLLADPEPPPLIGIEEPENGLYPRLQTILAEELREACEAGRTQVILATHSPHLVNALTPSQVFLMGKDEAGEVNVTRTSEIPTIQALYDEGIPLGTLWYSNHFGEWSGE